MIIELRYDRFNADDVSLTDGEWREVEGFVQACLGSERVCEVIGAKALSEAISKACKGDVTYKAELEKVTDSMIENLHRVIREKYIDAVRARIGGVN